jgi:inorganic triphosphatase YgiF
MEKEAKFPVPDPVVWQGVARARRVAGLEQIPLGRERQHNVYFDTEEGTLGRLEYACRLRRIGERYLLAVKGPADPQGEFLRRYEAERPISREELEEGVPPSQLVWELLPDHVRSEVTFLGPLRPTLRSGTERRLFALEKDGRRVCELALDEVNFELPGGEAPVYRELELELKSGSEGELACLIRRFREEWGLRPSQRSKLEVGLSLMGRRWPPRN